MSDSRVSYRRRLLVLIDNGNTTCGICGGNLSKEINEYLKFKNAQKVLGSKGLKMTSPSKRRLKINIDCDHIIPHSKGGLNRINNYQLTHRTCNSKKGNKYD